MIFDRGGNEIAAAPARAPADHAAAGMGRARSDGDRRAQRRSDRARAAQRQHQRGGSRRDRRHQPARDHDRLEPEDRASPGTTRSSGRTRAPIASSTRSTNGTRSWSASRTGLPPATYFSGAKIQWILDNVAGVRDAAERGEAVFGNPDTWVIWNLTGGRDGGVHATDVTNASRTMLMDLETCEWDDELLRIFNIPRAMLPAIHASADRQRVRRHAQGRAVRRRGAASPATSAISRPRPSARSASSPVKRRTPTAPATSCSSTRAATSSRRKPAC